VIVPIERIGAVPAAGRGAFARFQAVADRAETASKITEEAFTATLHRQLGSPTLAKGIEADRWFKEDVRNAKAIRFYAASLGVFLQL
jgi:hypothetical protein